jgi:DNA primase
MRFSAQFLDEIRARVPIADVVGRRVSWDRRKSVPAKGDYWACCPFHNEKTPSFHADNRRGRYHCFGCGVSGDAFTFLVEKEGLAFPEAVERLAAEAGLEMPKADPREAERQRQQASLHDVMELACAFFEDRLQTSQGAAARGYLADRGLDPATQRRFRIGYAPAGRHALKEHLLAKKVPLEAIVATGLLVTGEDIEVPFDRFRQRIMFPIADLRGRLAGFGGRALSPDVPAKYLNSPETEIFSKGRLLYNAAAARRAAQDAGTVIAVEGYMDVIALARAGIDNTVAPLGTALTEAQLEALWRMADEPVLCFDGDAAGLRAAYRAADMALPMLRPGKSLRFALLAGGQDPDDLIRAEGEAAMRAALGAAEPLIDVLWRREREAQDLSTPERRAAFEARVRALGRGIGDEAVRRHYLQALEERLALLWRPAGEGRRGAGAGRGGGRQRPAFAAGGGGRAAARAFTHGAGTSLRNSSLARGGSGAVPPREAVLVLAPLNHPELLEAEIELIGELELTNPRLDRLRAAILDIAAWAELPERQRMRDELAARGLADLVEDLEGLARRARLGFALSGATFEEARRGWQQALVLHHKTLTLNRELRDAERAFAEEGSEESYARLVDIRQKISSAEGTEALSEDLGGHGA